MRHADVVGYEVILKGRELAGHVTSSGFGHFVGKSLAVGYVPSELAQRRCRPSTKADMAAVRG